MPNFVEPCDAREFREEIISLFCRNGSQMLSQHFDWYYGHRADGKILSWVLRQRRDHAVAGLCSVIPRTFRFGDRSIRVGVVGNLMVDRESRGIGGLALLRSVQALVKDQFDILLGQPTLGTPIDLALRMGFRVIAPWQTYIQIFRSRPALSARHRTGGVALSPLVDLVAAARRRFSAFRQESLQDFALEEIKHDQLASLQTENWPGREGCFLAEFSPASVESRFIQKP